MHIPESVEFTPTTTPAAFRLLHSSEHLSWNETLKRYRQEEDDECRHPLQMRIKRLQLRPYDDSSNTMASLRPTNMTIDMAQQRQKIDYCQECCNREESPSLAKQHAKVMQFVNISSIPPPPLYSAPSKEQQLRDDCVLLCTESDFERPRGGCIPPVPTDSSSNSDGGQLPEKKEAQDVTRELLLAVNHRLGHVNTIARCA